MYQILLIKKKITNSMSSYRKYIILKLHTLNLLLVFAQVYTNNQTYSSSKPNSVHFDVRKSKSKILLLV